MKQDAVHDGLIQINNAARIGKKEILINFASKLLIQVIDVMKRYGYVEDYEPKHISPEIIKVRVVLSGRINECKPTKPYMPVKVKNLQKYIERHLPGRGIGILILSTPKGVLSHEEAIKENVGGILLGYVY